MEAKDTQPDHTLFKSIQSDVTNLHLYWTVYRQMYAGSERRIALLNETGSLVFYVLQQLLADEATLAICRLTDPPATGKKENHSLPRLAEYTTEFNGELAASMSKRLEAIQKMAEPFRARRNRAIAHSDLATKLKLDADGLPGISRQMIEDVLREIRDLMNVYDHHYFNSTTAYEMVVPALGSDGDFLCEQLRRAVAFRDLERERKLDRELWTQGRYRDA